LIVTMLAGAASTAPARDESIDAFLEWVETSAIPVERWEMNDGLAAYLETALDGKRIVFLGEPGHFFNEKYDVQLMLVEHLARRGYRHLFIEGLGATTSEIVRAYVATGAPPDADGVDAARFDPYRDRVLGAVAADAPVFQRRLAASQRRFFHALHELSAARPAGDGPLTIHPLDVDMQPGGCRFTIDRLLARHDGAPEVAALRAQLAEAADRPLAERIARLETLRASLDEDDAARTLAHLPPADRRRLRQCVDCQVESLVFHATRQADGNMVRALVRREPAMFRQVEHALAALEPDAKVIMMAHTNHLSRIGADTTRARRPSVGEMIVAAHPGEVFSLWMLHDRGWLLNPMAAEPVEELRSDPARVEHLLARAGSTFLLPLHTGAAGERYLAGKRRFSYFSWYETATLTRQTDALFFIDEITALHE
jgi:erythromycin esterase-like protein